MIVQHIEKAGFNTTPQGSQLQVNTMMFATEARKQVDQMLQDPMLVRSQSLPKEIPAAGEEQAEIL